MQQEFISAIDVGSTKICALMARAEPDEAGGHTLTILGEGQVPSRGIRRGVVVNVNEATAAVGEAVEKCESEAGRHMLSAFVSIAGSHISTVNSTGVSPVDRRQGVTQADMQRALEAARAVALPQNQDVLHTIARHWTVDGQEEIQEPLNMSGYRLEVDAHIVTGSSTAISNLVQCVSKHDIDIDGLVLAPLASSSAVLKPEERRMGVAMVDIGGGTADIAVFREDGLLSSCVLDMGGYHLSHDIAMGMNTAFETAEQLKTRYGHALPERVGEDETVWASTFGERSERNFSRRFLCMVLEARATEMFELVRDRLEQKELLAKLPAGLVITGGTSQMNGMVELGRRILEKPVRVGAPLPSLPVTGLSRGLLSPAYATTAGLLLWGMRADAQPLRRASGADGPGPATPGATPAWWNRAKGMLRHLLPG